MSSLMSSPVSGSQPGRDAHESTQHILACHTGKPLHATDIHQSHRMISNVKHAVHLQVRSGSERNRRNLIPRISIDLQVRLDDHQLFPSSWVYSPIKIISYHPNDVKTSGLRPSSSSSTYRRISYSEWDKPGLPE